MKYTHLTTSYNIFTFATAKLFLGMKSTKRITFFHLSTLWFKQIVIVCDLIELYSTLRTFFLSRGEEIWKVIVRFRKKNRDAQLYPDWYKFCFETTLVEFRSEASMRSTRWPCKKVKFDRKVTKEIVGR